ncbi:MAG: acetyltransferase [Helicobacteraceae bacterium]|jgi:sugar O-acyltransferase (sialic acid O-acetyltransferase NeuD family)|nr:acetyltransferase [Helicobacteraceae bacterium]
MGKSLLIIGAGGHARSVLESATFSYEKISFFASDPKSKIDGYEVFSGELPQNFDEFIVAIGDNKTRLKLTREYIAKGLRAAIIIHPSAIVSDRAKIGLGSVVLAGAIINAFAEIGAACIINTGAIVEHDCRIGDGAHLSPGAALGGTAIVGEASWICIGANVANNITIGWGAIVAAGAAVVRDVPSDVLAAGVPATVKKELK